MSAVRIPLESRPNDAVGGPAPLGDMRFRALLGEAAWAGLPPAVRRRFSKRVACGETAVYAGTVTRVRMSRLGRLLANAARLIGGPLPLHCETGVASVVTVTEDGAGGGQVWTRLYARRRGLPQVIHSAKLFAGGTGLEEHIGRGFGMALRVAVRDGVLEFHSAGFFATVMGLRVALPHWLVPLTLLVTHRESAPGRFRFTLGLSHAWAGALLDQEADFGDAI